MTEIPEHLLQRSKERRKALGLPVPGEEEGEAAAAPAETAGDAGEVAEVAEAPAAAPAAAAAAPAEPMGDVELPGGGRIPAHLLQRSRDRRVALGLDVPGAPAGGAPGAEVPAAAGAARAATATATLPAPTVTGPGRPHPTLAHGRQVRLDPGDARRSRRQGAHVAAPSRRRVRVAADRHRCAHHLLGRWCARRCCSSRTSTRHRTRRRRRGTSSASRNCSPCSTRWSRA